jgi:hypothetical protein
MRHQATAFEQIVEHFPWARFDHHVRLHHADDEQRGFTSRHHFLALLAGALGGHAGLRPLIASLAPNGGALRLLGGVAPARSTMADAMRDRAAQFFIDLLLELVGHVSKPSERQALKTAVRLIDATQLDVGNRMRHWLGLAQNQVVAKLHVVFDPRAQKPVFFALTSARSNDITAAKELLPIEKGALYVFDLGYYDFAWWAELAAAGCSFVTRLKRNSKLREVETRAVDPAGNVLSDRVGLLAERLAARRRNPFQHKAREITIRTDAGKILRLFTNDLEAPAEQIAALYKERWQIELFFKWIKQNLQVERFIGSSENAIRSQIAVCFIAYLLVRMLHAKQDNRHRPIIVLLLVRTHLFVRRPIHALLQPNAPSPEPRSRHPNQFVLHLCK